MSSIASNEDYPSPAVAPELFGGAGACDKNLPVGLVSEFFHFAQFVELYATDSSMVAHPLVVTHDDAVLQESLRIREDSGAPTRTVDLAGGVPLSHAAAGDGTNAFKTIGKPEEIFVQDVDELVRTGTIASGATTYSVTLRGRQIDDLRDGERQLLRARAETTEGTRRVWIQLTPTVAEVPVPNLNELLADPRVAVGKGTEGEETVTLKLEPVEVGALLTGRTVVVRGLSGSKTRLVRLRQREDVEVGFAAHPAVTDYAIKDLAGFLTNPVVPGIDHLSFKVPLTALVVQRLRGGTSAQISLGDGQLLTLRVEEARP
jgi:hypothetical protein